MRQGLGGELRRVILVSVCAAVLSGCGVFYQYATQGAIHRIAGRGRPPADRLVWSKMPPDRLLISASSVGFDMSLNGAAVYVLDVSTGKRSAIATTKGGGIRGDTWSPAGDRVVPGISQGTQGYEEYEGLWIWQAGGTSLEFLRARGHAIWSPSGRRIAVVEIGRTGDVSVVSVLDVQTTHWDSYNIGEDNSTGYVWGADWSPDERRLVLSMGNPPASIPDKLYVYDLPSRALIPITAGGDDSEPTWSPRGDVIAYVRQEPGRLEDTLHLMDAEGRCDIAIPYVERANSPSWSPDGGRLAFVGSDGIYIIDLAKLLGRDITKGLCAAG